MRTTKASMLAVIILAVSLSAWGEPGDVAVSGQPLGLSAVYATTGFGLVGGALNLSYELRLFTFSSSFWKDVRVRALFGSLSSWGGNYLIAQADLEILVGTGNHHLEAGVGAATDVGAEQQLYAFSGRPPLPDTTHIWPDANIGYRFQKPGASFILRLGVGWLEGAHVSLGFGF